MDEKSKNYFTFSPSIQTIFTSLEVLIKSIHRVKYVSLGEGVAAQNKALFHQSIDDWWLVYVS